ncbi:hypothetical protein FNV64_21145 [Streptomyces sp. S1A1-7]|uniref:hypothetical protein n=1 Tax=Streptomyces sp. S1A1-7 TaxID=2594459 RepID=UPI001163441F|nr:hypothetical protein [Streptomyces sp. S1A1-7]QDN77776.1 hypothetical protein FNV64_21145 [Streptomyces sp. S1A1-7]
MSDEEITSPDDELDDREQDAIRLISKFKISLHDTSQDFVALSAFEKMTSPREVNRSPSTVYFPRTFLPDLHDQLQSGIIPHSTLRGIVGHSAGYVELVLQDSRLMGSSIRLRRASTAPGATCSHIEEGGRIPTLQKEDYISIDLHIPGTGATCLEISPASPACYALTSYGSYALRERNSFGLTVKVYMASNNADQMEVIAGKAVASLLYELNIRNGIQYRIDRWLATRGDRSILQRKVATSIIRFPEISIKPDMATLFGFAASTLDNPPLAFLSYYQILEHNLASAVKRRALGKIGKELADPLFNRSSRDDLLRIFMIGERSTHMSESAQLRTLIDECVRPESLVDFFAAGDQLSHFGKKGPIVGVETINPSNTQISLAAQVADRIYGIRNRIVHAKDDPRYGEVPTLLPESHEADALWPDIMLARLLATEVILDGHSGV